LLNGVADGDGEDCPVSARSWWLRKAAVRYDVCAEEAVTLGMMSW